VQLRIAPNGEERTVLWQTTQAKIATRVLEIAIVGLELASSPGPTISATINYQAVLNTISLVLKNIIDGISIEDRENVKIDLHPGAPGKVFVAFSFTGTHQAQIENRSNLKAEIENVFSDIPGWRFRVMQDSSLSLESLITLNPGEEGNIPLEQAGLNVKLIERIETLNEMGFKIRARIEPQTKTPLLDIQLESGLKFGIMINGWKETSAIINGHEIIEQEQNRAEPWSGIHIMSPWVGRMKGGKLASPTDGEPIDLLDGSIAQFIKTEDNGHAHHGVVDKLASIWEVTRLEQKGIGLVLTARFDSRRYPALAAKVGEYTLDVTYQLSQDGIGISDERENVGQTPMRNAYGPHPWVIGNNDNVFLRFKAKTRIVTDAQGIAIGTEEISEGSTYDFSKFRPANSVPLDFTFADLEADADGVVTVEVLDQEKGIIYTYQWKKEHFGFMQIWNGNEGKSLSIEPTTEYAGSGADGVHLEGYETPLMQPGQKSSEDFMLQVKTNQGANIKRLLKSAAMMSLLGQRDAASIVQPPGGIDLNTSNGMKWKINKQGNGVQMNIDPAMLADIREHGIGSLSPVVLRMTPITSIWMVAGIQAPHQN